MASYKSVLLIGASGMLGRAVQEELITQKGNFSKLGVLTTSASSPDKNKDAYWASLEAKGVQIIKADFSNNYDLVKAFTGWDAVISAVGLPLVKTQLPLIEAAAAAGVKRFLPSEFGFDLTIPSNTKEKVYAMKIAVADKLKEVSKAYPGFTYTFLTIGSFAAFPFMVPAMFDLDFENCKANIIGDGEAQVSFTSSADVASFAVAVLSHPEETKNTTIRVEGATASWNDIIKLLEKIQGKIYTVTYQSTEDAQAKETEFWAIGNPGAARYALRRVMAQGNAKVPVVQNDLFPEVKVTTNLVAIISNVLRDRGIVKA